jgi:hypothetical protein
MIRNTLSFASATLASVSVYLYTQNLFASLALFFTLQCMSDFWAKKYE